MQNDVALYDNATLGKKSASLLGESVVVLTPGTPDNRKLHDGDEIHVIADQTTPAEIMDEVKEIADSVKAVAEQLANSIGTEQGGQNMRHPAEPRRRDRRAEPDRSARTARSSATRCATSTRITQNANPQMAQILENVRVVTEDVRELMAAQGAEVAPERARSATRSSASISASKSLESTLEHADSVAGRIDRGEGTIGRLTKDETLINEVQGVAEGVNDYVRNITRLQTIVGLRSDYNFLANTIKSYVSLRLQPREDKYYEIELINDPRGFTSITDTSVDTTNPNEPAHYRTITTTTTDAFRFSLQFAKRIGPVHRPLRHQGVDGRHRPRHPPPARPLRDRERPLRLRRGGPAALPRLRRVRVHQAPVAPRRRRPRLPRRASATTSSGCSSASPTRT